MPSTIEAPLGRHEPERALDAVESVIALARDERGRG